MACVHAATAKASTIAKCLITLSSSQWLTMTNNDGKRRSVQSAGSRAYFCRIHPRATRLSPLRNRDARWVKPVITLKVKHLAFGGGLLRHATVRGVSRSLNMFDVLLIGTMEKSVGSTEPWHDICRKPMTYPPPDSHPLSTAERENTA